MLFRVRRSTNVVVANFGPGIPLKHGSRYVWRSSIDDREDEDWCIVFSTRSMPPQSLAE
jgi:hypothetical protein